MSDESLEHKIRASIGKMFHHKHHNPDGEVNIEDIASEHGVSEDQVREQMTWLRSQNILALGPLAVEGQQISDVPADVFEDDHHHLTDEGLAWSMAGYPVL